MLFPLHNSSSCLSNLIPGQNIVWLYVCTKRYRKSQELAEEDKKKNPSFIYNSESNSHRKINDNRSKISAVSDFYERMERS